ncbi:polysaccharide deacetylase family protein [uncultured Methylibium sp.]|uniref:polysaccharide deacetylase family protein n=1 Tax=uncultured Methylibium sp. TaxID=381093 RepID=UPI0025F535AD|nr:polysaccharide deacetylase family protein [uncultured Methylibium sp.]
MSVATSSGSPWTMPPLLRASFGLHALAAGAAVAVPDAAPWALGSVVANHAALTAAGLWPRSRWLGPNVTQLPAGRAARGEIALTIDDGPDPEVTPRVLDLLDAQDVRATFFCIAERAREHAALTREIVARGHSVQNHSLAHRHNFSLLGPRGYEAELSRAQQLLADLTGQRPTCFRAPAGLRNPFLDPVLHRLGLHLVSWTRRGFDTRERSADRVLARLTQRLAGGDILLLHDGHAARAASGRPVLLDVLPLLLAQARAAGLHWVTLAEALPPRGTASA